MGIWVNGVSCTEWGVTNIQTSSATATSFTFETDIVFNTLRVEFSDYSSMSSSAQGITQPYFDYQSTSGTQTDTITCNNGSLPGKTLRIWLDYLWDQPYVTVNFTSPPEVTWPTNISASQEMNGTTKITWKACTGSGGTGTESLTYTIHKGENGPVLKTTSATTVTLDIASCFGYGTNVQIYVRSHYGTADEWNYINKTFYAPSISPPSSLKISDSIGPSTTISWSAAKLSHTTGTITYTVLKNGVPISGGTTPSTKYDILESVAKTWGSSAVTLTVQANGTDLSNTYSGRTLTSAASNGVSYTYSSITDCKVPETFTISNSLSYMPVQLTWNGAENGVLNTITAYHIQYQDCADGTSWPNTWIDLETDCPVSPLEVSPPDTIGHYRRFRIQVKGSAGADYYSDWLISSNILRKDMAPFKGFTDHELITLSTKIKAIHMTEMQNRINEILIFEGKQPYAFTQFVAGQTKLTGWTNHVNELRSALNQLDNLTVEWIEILENRPRADVINQIRNVINLYN